VVKAGNFNEDKIKYSSQDIRFTAKGNNLYAFCLNIPEGDIYIRSLSKESKLNNRKIASVTMLGNNEKIIWQQDADNLVIKKPSLLPDWKVLGFSIVLQ
jgi:alpha-L-fucosidase